MDIREEREEMAVNLMHGLAAEEDVEATNIRGEENMAGELLVTAAMPEEQTDRARDVADRFGFKDPLERGEDERTDKPRFAFMPRI